MRVLTKTCLLRLSTIIIRPITHISMSLTSQNGNCLRKLEDWSNSAENTWLTLMKADSYSFTTAKSQFIPREVRNAHYTAVKTEPAPSPYVIATSDVCAQDIGLDPEELKTAKFLSVFSGNEMLSGLSQAYSTVYGCHSYGQWFGQLGDGRAMSLGEVKASNDERYELQLKGCGRSPYSRGFDGRAVLRSSVREYLVSEAMYHLRVPTTRALSIIGTGETVQRAWYSDTMESRLKEPNVLDSDGRRLHKYPPNRAFKEPGAIVCRVARSFLRLTHLEIFSKRQEIKELMEMADFVCLREFPHLLEIKMNTDNESSLLISNETIKGVTIGPPERYVQLYREVARNNAYLVAEWLRVGYVQGNMNSDNTCLAGRTIDYGPYGWMEKFEPYYQPFTSDPNGNFAFQRQPSAMGLNIAVLGDTFEVIVAQACKMNGMNSQLSFYKQQIKDIAQNEFREYFFQFYNEVRRKKLGFKTFEAVDSELWTDLEILMASCGCDHTMFFRELIKAASQETGEKALDCILSTFYNTLVLTNELKRSEWIAWFNRYLERIKTDARDIADRENEQSTHNPKFVLRNWMCIQAYERASEGDFSVINELQELLKNPYSEQSSEMTEKWYKKTPNWARDMPGATFMSCSS